MADGPVLLGLRAARRARLGGPAPLAGARSCSPPAPACVLPPAHPRLARAAGRWSAARVVYALTPVRPHYCGPHLGAPAAVRRAAVAASALTDPGAAARGLALPGAVRARRRHRRQRERHRAAARRARARCCGCPYAVLGRPRGAAPPRRSAPWPASASSRCGRSLWWIAGLWRPGRLRHRRSSATPRRSEVVARTSLRLGGAARPRLLVLLRRRQARAVDRAGVALHPELCAARCSASPPDRSALVAAVAPLAPPGLLRRCSSWSAPSSRSAPTRGTSPSLVGRRVQGVRRESDAGLAMRSTAAGRAARRARPAPCSSAPGVAALAAPPAPAGAVARRRRRRARRRRPARRCGPGPWSPRTSQRPEEVPDVLAARPPPTSTAGRRRHPRARDPGHRLRVVPLGQHRRPDHARADRPALRRPRADPLRLAAVGRPAQRPRPPPAGGHRSTPTPSPPIARLMGVGDVVLRVDLQYERYNTPRPRPTVAAPAATRRASATPVGVRRRRPQRARRRPPAASTSSTLAIARGRARPAAGRGRSRSRTPCPSCGAEPARRPVLVAGDGDGLVDAAAAGLLDGAELGPATRAALADDAAGSSAAARRRRRPRAHRHQPAPGRRWSTVRENAGYTEQAGERAARRRPRPTTGCRCSPTPATTPSPWPSSAACVAVDGHRVRQPDHLHARGPARQRRRRRPRHRLAGGRLLATEGERLGSTLDEPITTDEIEVVQPLHRPPRPLHHPGRGAPRRRVSGHISRRRNCKMATMWSFYFIWVVAGDHERSRRHHGTYRQHPLGPAQPPVETRFGDHLRQGRNHSIRAEASRTGSAST